jgi:hypothetical protein
MIDGMIRPFLPLACRAARVGGSRIYVARHWKNYIRHTQNWTFQNQHQSRYPRLECCGEWQVEIKCRRGSVVVIVEWIWTLQRCVLLAAIFVINSAIFAPFVQYF